MKFHILDKYRKTNYLLKVNVDWQFEQTMSLRVSTHFILELDEVL